MEVESDEFTQQVRCALEADLSITAALSYHVSDGFIGDLEDRDS